MGCNRVMMDQREVVSEQRCVWSTKTDLRHNYNCPADHVAISSLTANGRSKFDDGGGGWGAGQDAVRAVELEAMN